MKILLVEDDLMLASGLSKALNAEGFIVQVQNDGTSGLNAIAHYTPELVVLDLGLPDIDGVDILRQLRKTHPNLPVLVLTARHETQDKVGALDLGADDYLGKPFEMPELLARIRVIARRLGTASSNEVSHRNVTINLASQTVVIDHKEQILTRREFMILKSLMENLGRIQTKDMIESKLYGWGEVIGSNTIEVHISHLRKKLPKDFIRTIRGLGYTVSDVPKSFDMISE